MMYMALLERVPGEAGRGSEVIGESRASDTLQWVHWQSTGALRSESRREHVVGDSTELLEGWHSLRMESAVHGNTMTAELFSFLSSGSECYAELIC
ncbi:hypothetical protein AVEN_191475-1 [Araneus ventricosus]|uniref:Uncharacterized protein n=1 Tax=Araneus ventricosus TaxID=182803 RepID=A0A4Y2T3S0_ARAVE|nr:hypothetical protein AVEN_191475-1 [Araneus ventricosus]